MGWAKSGASGVISSLEEDHVGVDDFVIEPPERRKDTELRRGDIDFANCA